MLIALNKQSKIIYAQKDSLKNELFFCPACKGRVYLKTGEIIRPHFAHYRTDQCAVFSEGETKEHLEGKVQLAAYFKKEGYQVQLEAYLPKLKQRPDILIEKSNRKIAVEFQCSSISIEKMMERTEGYLHNNYKVLWILGNHFKYTGKLTPFQKACFYNFSEVNQFLLFHYDGRADELEIRHDFQMVTQKRIHIQLQRISLGDRKKIEFLVRQKKMLNNHKLKDIEKKHEKFEKTIRYPSTKTMNFLELLYENQENIVSMPKELYHTVPSEWMIKDFPMVWRYQLILWLESWPRKKILTIKMLERWLESKVQKEQIQYYENPSFENKERLRPFIEYIDLLERQKILKKIGQLKWSYQQPLKRYRNLKEKFNN